MSKPRYRWWGYVRRVIGAYPELLAELEDRKRPSATASYGVGGGGRGGTSDPTGRSATRQLGAQEQKELEAVEAAIAHTRRLPSGRERLRIIELVCWRRTHTIEGAARLIPCGAATAKRYHVDFVYCVAGYMGLITRDDTAEPKK